MATHSSILAWEIPWTEETGMLQFMGSQRVRHNLATEQKPPKQHIDPRSAEASLKVKVLVTLSCPTLCNSMDCSLPGSSVHGTLQARILEQVAFPFCRVSSHLRDQTQVSSIAGRFFTIQATREAHFFAGVCVRVCVYVCVSHSVLFDPLQPHRL